MMVLDDGAVKLSKRAKDMKDKLATGGVGVDILGQRPEADLTTFEVLDGLDELFHRPGEPIEPSGSKCLRADREVQRNHSQIPSPLRRH